jgi:primosomal protein N' (replication factor Y)
MPAVARVVPLTPVDKVYSYLVPAELDAEAAPGARVVVPFGPRTLTGVITERTEQAADGEFKLKPIRDVLDDAPSFSPVMLRLTRWIAEYYVCAWGEVLKAALPAGATVESQRVVHRTERPPLGINGTAGRVLDALEAEGPQSVGALQRSVKGATASLLRRLERDDLVRIEKELAPPAVTVKTEWHLRLADGVDGEAAEALRGSKQTAVIEALVRLQSEGEAEPRQADVLAETGASSSTLKSLVDKGLVVRGEKEMVRTPFDAMPEPAPPAAHALHAGQTTALTEIGEALAAREAKTFLLHGVTGSGKTEVYIQALKQTLAQGRTGIVLVPEIALTPQTVRRFRAHFGDRVAVLHSRMSQGERYDAWRHLQSGRFTVAIGPRSAIFAPLRDVGLVVVDEEHEASYKQFDPAPRYHARDVAVMRAHLEGAVCVLGSATPSLESYLNAKGRERKYTLLRMPVRVPIEGIAAELPPVEIVDLTREKKVRRLKGALSHPLREAIRDRLTRGEGIILLQNRRGYSPVVTCDSCGWTPQCRDCAVSLTYHKSHRHLRCHYCGRVERLSTACPQCGADDLTQLGAGTQRVQEELAEVFPSARVLRMDLDTTGKKNAHQRILDAFGRGDADILIGTQMVAKGLDFERVTLVGVVDADTGLLLPDFRAAERTFQLLMQVAGRAGRGALRGEVILQTRSPENAALQRAAEHDFLGFLRTELPDRQAFGYPPFGRLVGVEFKGPDERAVQRVAERWTRMLQRAASTRAGGIEVLGPEPAFIGRVKKQYRFHTIVKAGPGQHPYALPRLVRDVQERFGRPPKAARINVDVDPIGLL